MLKDFQKMLVAFKGKGKSNDVIEISFDIMGSRRKDTEAKDLQRRFDILFYDASL